MNKLVLIDSNAIIHRAYHALPKSMSIRGGELTNAVYGFATTLIKVLEDLKPTHLAASFDISKATFRVEKYEHYKATRVAADQELYDQIPKVKELLAILNIPIYEKEGFEADDCIGTITELVKKERENGELEVYIVTGDKDLYQLIDGNIFVYSLRRGLADMVIFDRQKIKEEYNLDPRDFIDLKALAGDPSDNIPGVPGIGPKTATTLLQNCDTLENLYKIVEKSGRDEATKSCGVSDRILNLLIDNKEQALLSQNLATIHKSVPIEFSLDECLWGDYDKSKVREFFEAMQFHSLLRRFGVESSKEVKTKQAQEQKKKDEQLKLL